MQFNFSYAQGVSQTQMAAFEMAGKIWASYLTDKVTINIAVDVQKDFAGNTIAGAISRVNEHSFDKFSRALQEDITSSTDRTAMSSNAFASKDFEARFDIVDKHNQRGNSREKSTKLQVNSANAKALGLDEAGNVLDGYIVMRDLTGTNTSWDYNFTRGNTTPSSAVDFISVAVHEIGHVLGFQSSVDRPWFNADLDSKDYASSLKERVSAASPLDLFRYSDRSDIGDKEGVLKIDLAIGGNPFLSLSGEAVIGRLDTGVDVSKGGSGKQASHWESGGIMDAEIQRGERPAITNLDLTAFDAIGWNIDTKGLTKTINYAQLGIEAQQIASQKTTQNIGNAMALMFDSTDIYKPKSKSKGDASLTTTEARTGGWWQQFYARTGGWWQEYFARTGGWWQGIKGAFGEEAVFDSIEGGDIEFLEILNQYATDSWTNGNDIDALTGKAEGAMLVGEDSSIELGVSATSQFIDFGFAQPFGGLLSNGSSLLDQQQISQGLEFGAAQTLSNVVLGSNKSQLSSISDSSQLLGESFTPWWLGDSSSLWAAR
jgi:hypothetical protein